METLSQATTSFARKNRNKKKKKRTKVEDEPQTPMRPDTRSDENGNAVGHKRHRRKNKKTRKKSHRDRKRQVREASSDDSSAFNLEASDAGKK